MLTYVSCAIGRCRVWEINVQRTDARAVVRARLLISRRIPVPPRELDGPDVCRQPDQCTSSTSTLCCKSPALSQRTAHSKLYDSDPEIAGACRSRNLRRLRLARITHSLWPCHTGHTIMRLRESRSHAPIVRPNPRHLPSRTFCRALCTLALLILAV